MSETEANEARRPKGWRDAAPMALAAWAGVVCAGTFAWLALPPAPPGAGGAMPLETSEVVSVAVSHGADTRYLAFTLAYRRDPARPAHVPVEAAVRDALIEAAPHHPELAGENWREAVRRILHDARGRLGLSDVRLRDAQRSPAP